MKKLVILTSILALAACGGGSGGGHGGSDIGGSGGNHGTGGAVEVGPWNEISPEASNAKVIGLVPVDNTEEVMAAVREKLGADAVPDFATAQEKISDVENIRFLGADVLKAMVADSENPLTKERLYDSWKLLGGDVQDLAKYDNINDLIDFVVINWPAEWLDDRFEHIKLSLDEAIFDSAESRNHQTDMMQWTFRLDDEGRIAELVYKVDSDDYNEHGEMSYTRIGDNTFKDAAGDIVTVNMMGHDVGLKYSDFGVIGHGEIVAGGYEYKSYGNEHYFPQEKMVFKGRAVGSLYDGDEENFSDLMYGNSMLIFENGKSALNMNFKDSGWYDVNIKATADRVTNVSFDGVASSKYKQWDIANGGKYDAWADIGYYDDGNPDHVVEAAGTFHYEDGQTGTVFNAGFGGTRQ